MDIYFLDNYKGTKKGKYVVVDDVYLNRKGRYYGSR